MDNNFTKLYYNFYGKYYFALKNSMEYSICRANAKVLTKERNKQVRFELIKFKTVSNFVFAL